MNTIPAPASPLKKVFVPHLKHHVVFGRKTPTTVVRKLHFKDFITKTHPDAGTSLPTPPPSFSYGDKARPALKDIFGNDAEGDCIYAAGYHLVGVATGNANNLFHATLAQVLADYSAVTGYDPANPASDQGGLITDALDYWTTHGFANGSRLAGWLAVDPSNWAEVKLVCYLFENLIFGVSLPDPYITPFPPADGFVWGPAGAPNPENGHCFMAYGCTDEQADIDTWALEGGFTKEAIAIYCSRTFGGEIYVAITPDMIDRASGRAPTGLDWNALIAAFQEIGGAPVTPPAPVAPPTPDPVSPPAPDPVSPPAPSMFQVSLAEAIQWAMTGSVVNSIMLLDGAPNSDIASPQEFADWIAANWPLVT